MSCDLQANILTFERGTYNVEEVLQHVTKFMRGLNKYESKFFGDITSFSKIDGEGARVQPFVDVYDTPESFSEWSANHDLETLPETIARIPQDRLLRMIRIGRGSHVSFQNISEARQIYDTSQNLHMRLQTWYQGQVTGREVFLLFDDGHRFYVPTEFDSGIRRAQSDSSRRALIQT